MPAYIFKNTTYPNPVSFVPSDYGITNSTVIRVHAVGNSGQGADNDVIGSGGGGGGGERCGSEHTVSDASASYTVYIPNVNESSTTYFRDPDNITDIVAALNGTEGSGSTGGSGGSGGTGSLYARSGGDGGVGGVAGGGGGGSAGTDAANGNTGSAGGATGGSGGSGGTQLGVANACDGGDGGDATQNGIPGEDYGAGGGGGGELGGLGADGGLPIIIIVWGDLLNTYPPAPFSDGPYGVDQQTESPSWFFFLGI